MHFSGFLSSLVLLTAASGALAGADPSDVAIAASADIVSVHLDDSRGTVDLQIKTRGPSDFSTLLLLIDADNNHATGFDAPAFPGHGYEFVVQGDGLFRFAGTDRTAWQWERVATVKRTIEHDTLVCSIVPTDLTAKTLGVTALYMSADMQTPVDVAPDKAPLKFTTKLTVGKPRVADIKMSAPRPDRGTPARQRFAKAKSFYTYYGSKRVAELSHYDAVVLHTPAMAKEDVKTLSDLGVVTIGYISVGEDDQMRVGDGTGPAGKASWYFDRDKDGQPDQNGIWKSWFANANDPKWRADRVEEARRLVLDYGFDGIFLDTIDTSQNYAESKPGMIQLIRELREALPKSVIVLNQGFEVLPDVAQYGDGLMLESFTASYDFDTKQYIMNLPQSLDFHTRRVEKTIAPVRKKHPLQVLVLDYAGRDDRQNMEIAANRAATFGFLFSCAPIFLDDVYANVPAGTPDARWLSMQASPEAMSFKMTGAKNGFDAGTVLTPSGCFAGYTIAPIVDGELDRRKFPWSKAAWASMEDSEPAWVEFKLPAAKSGGALHVYFHDESGPSRNYRVDVRKVGAKDWTTVDSIEGNTQRNRASTLPHDRFDAIRIWQPQGGGSVGRPDLLWIAQVVLEN